MFRISAEAFANGAYIDVSTKDKSKGMLNIFFLILKSCIFLFLIGIWISGTDGPCAIAFGLN